MKTFVITFITEDGNTNQVFVEATSKERAILKFENDYQHASIKYLDEL